MTAVLTGRTVKRFDRSMVEQCVKDIGWKYLKDSDGDCVVQFARDEDTGCELTLYLIADGSNENLYSVRLVSDRKIPREQWGKILTLCNTWNQDRRWPKAYLCIQNPDTDSTATIVLEEQIDLEQGIHQELLDDFTLTVFSAGNLFWTWLHKEKNF